MNTESFEPQGRELNRRSLIKRAAVVGAATAWATPTVQSITAPAFATGTPQGGCTARMTGGGNNQFDIVGATYNGSAAKISFGLGQLICMPGDQNTELEVNVHNPDGGTLAPGDRESWHFIVATIDCEKVDPNPAPGPGTATCANAFFGTAVDRDDPNVILTFRFEDHGEGGAAGDMDTASIHIAGGADTVDGTGYVQNGNLQVHDNIPGVQRDCSGC